MSTFLLLSLTAIASMALIAAAASIVLFRSGVRPLGYWLFAWSALLQAAFLTLLVPQIEEVAPLVPLLSTFVAPFMLLGAYAHANRREPMWIAVVAFAVGILRTGFQLGALDDASNYVAVVAEPALGLAAAWVVLHPRAVRSRSDVALAVGFLLYAGVEFFDGVRRSQNAFGWTNWIAWIGVALPLVIGQIVLHLGRIGGNARRRADEFFDQGKRLEVLSKPPFDFVLELDDRGVVTYVSPGVSSTVGRRPEDFVGRGSLEFLDPDVPSVARDVFASGRRLTPDDLSTLSSASHRVVLPSGTKRWLQFIGTSYRTAAGELRFLARILDVTERIEDDQRIRKSEARLRRAERIGGVGSWEFDLCAGKATLSDQAHRILGLDPALERVDDRILLRLIHPDDVRLPARLWARARDEGIDGEQTFRIVRPGDRAIRTIRLLVETDRDESGAVNRLVGTAVDVTETFELTSRLREQERRLRTLVDSNIVCVFFYRHDDRMIHEANHAFLRLLGYTARDLPIRLADVADAGALEGESGKFDRDGAPQTPVLFEHEVIARDGRRIPMLLTYAVLPSEGSIVIGADQSERKAVEADRERRREELEETVALRTRELVESRSRLIEQERLAAVGTLAAGVAHQINNPIGAILNCSEYALLCRDDDEVLSVYERALQDNRDEAQRCAQIVRSMLQFSRDQPTSKWVEDLPRVVRRAIRAITAYAQDRGARLDFETMHEELLARISPIELEQAIVNVLRNAIESRASGVAVSIRLARRDKFATIEVTDDGRGIPPEDLDRLFEPFFSTRTREGGTGLGLSVTHGIVTDHGGSVRVESILGTGTRVLITLPIDEDPVEPRDASADPSAGALRTD